MAKKIVNKKYGGGAGERILRMNQKTTGKSFPKGLKVTKISKKKEPAKKVNKRRSA